MIISIYHFPTYSHLTIYINFMYELLLSMPTFLFYMIRKFDRRECIYAIYIEVTLLKIDLRRQLLVFLNVYRSNPQVHGITVVTFHPKVFRVSYFHRERMCSSLLSSLPKVARRKIAQVARFSMDRDPKLTLPLYTYFGHRLILGLPSTSGFQLYVVP
jgi:hypothetical protein